MGDQRICYLVWLVKKRVIQLMTMPRVVVSTQEDGFANPENSKLRDEMESIDIAAVVRIEEVPEPIS